MSELEEESNANNNAATSESTEKVKEEEVDPINVRENTGGGTEEPEKQKAPGTETSVSEENVVEDELSVD